MVGRRVRDPFGNLHYDGGEPSSRKIDLLMVRDLAYVAGDLESGAISRWEIGKF